MAGSRFRPESIRLRVILGIYWEHGKENGNYYSILGFLRGYIGIMEKKMESTIVYWGYIGDILR